MKKYLIIGGAGFIGSHLCEALFTLGNNVVVVDDFSTGVKKKVRGNIKLYKVNIDNGKAVERIFKKEKPDTVYHLAGAINLRRKVSDPLFLKSLNVLGRTKIILDACKVHSIKKLIFASSGGAMYEYAKIVPTNEEYLAHPTSLYGLANAMTEKYIEKYAKEYGLQYAILRLSNVYGPRQWESGIIPSLINNILNDKRPIIYGDGKQTRDFIYIADVVEACISAMVKNMSGIYNIGSGKEASLNEIFKLIKKVTGNTSIKPIYQKPKNEESKRSALNIQKIKKEINWKPTVDLKEGLAKTVKWFKETNNNRLVPK